MEILENKWLKCRILGLERAGLHRAPGANGSMALNLWKHSSSLLFLYSQSRLCVTRK